MSYSLDFWLLSFEWHLVLPCWKRECFCFVIVSPDTLSLWLSISCFLELPQGTALHFLPCVEKQPSSRKQHEEKTHSKTTTTLPHCLPSPLIWKLMQSENMFWCWTCFDGVAAELGNCSCFQHAYRETPSHPITCGHLIKQIVQQREGRGLG